ncbi:MAG TPA: RHS repeat-associated core domain-containing protein [Dehalococcoidia bacterium]|nr:RHS repeat-associated core domain-containing protein [Dehalococcoidia bacterium]
MLKDAFVNPVVGYEYQGPYRMASKTLRGGLAWEGQATYDATRRLLGWSSTNGDGHRVFAESLSWYPRNVKQSITRGDLNDARLNLTYDGASRLLAAQRQADASNAFTAGLPQQWSFEYDEAQNLLERNEDGCCGDTTQVAMPPDDSQRNRPESVGGTPLAWDGSGNLTSKGSYTFHYDYRNRLIKVEHPQQATVEYAYDAFNRRVEKRVAGGATETTVWSGWRELETYANGVLKERVTYGAGLDEIVRLENVTSGLVHLPVYDATGNLVMVLDAGGHPVERYEYSPFGERWIFADSDPPEIEQVRLKDGAIWLEISEEVDFEELRAAVGDGRLVLTDDDESEPLSITISKPVGGGRQAGRRVVITPSTTPAVGTQVMLGISAGTLFDFFGNAGEDSLELTFDWPAGDLIFLDAVAPRVEQVCTKNGALEVQFSEEVDPSLATGLVLVDGQAQTWSLAADRYTLIGAPLTDGVHELSITAGSALDLNGLGLASGFAETFSVGGGTPAEQVVWSAGALGSIATSAVGNRFGFHGRPLDVETGLLYFRNRYYDPELGRFITTDPLGYVDGPSAYQFAGYSPFNNGDSLGLYIVGGAAELRAIKQALRDAGAFHMAYLLNLQEYPVPRKNRKLLGPRKETRIVLTGRDVDTGSEIADFIRSAIESEVRIEFTISTKSNRGFGGVTTGMGPMLTPMFDPGRPDSENRITIEINPTQVARLLVAGPTIEIEAENGVGRLTDTRIPVPLSAAVIHEFGHAYYMYGLRNFPPLDKAETNKVAVEWENKYRVRVGLPKRQWH